MFQQQNEIMNLNMIKSKVAHATGTGLFYRRQTKNCVYTEGIKHYLELAQCQWLYDVIETEVAPKLRQQELDIYYLVMVVTENSAVITLTDHNDVVIHIRDIRHTDHPEGTMPFIFGWDGNRCTLCLPSEN